MKETARTPASIVEDIFDALGIELDHPSACHDEARHWLDAPGIDDPSLTDWRSVPFVTMDNADSRDLDQALHIERTDTGYRLRYALADAAYYIRPGSALFAEALRRGTTFYSPVMAAPMLPRSLSEGLLSLNPNVDRRALVFDMQLDDTASEVTTSIVRALVHSQAKLSYAGVQAWLDDDANHAKDTDEANFAPSLRLLGTLGDLLIQRGLERGVVPFERHETEVTVGDAETSGASVFHLEMRARLDTERYNEQLSLLCNMEGAALLQDSLQHIASHEAQPVFRRHDPPLDARRRELERTLQELADARNLDQAWRLEPTQSLASYVSNLKDKPGPDSLHKAVQRQILLSQRASTFTPEPGLHYALAAPAYARFSSPMREVVGIFTHKELLEALAMEQPSSSAIEDDRLRERIIESANQAKQTQRKIEKAVEFQVIDQLLRDDLAADSPPPRRATVMGIRDKRLYLQLDDPSLDLKVYQQDLEAQHQSAYQLSDIAATPEQPSAPTFTVGDNVLVFTLAWHDDRRRFVLQIEPT